MIYHQLYSTTFQKNKNLILVKSDLMNLDFKIKFDIVICRGVIQHTPNPKETIKKFILLFILMDLFFLMYIKCQN